MAKKRQPKAPAPTPQEPQMPPLPRVGDVYDFTAVETPRFKYRITNSKGEVEEHSLDMEAVVADLHLRIPTAMRAVEHTDEHGNPMSGLAYVMKCLSEGKNPPENLPSVHHIAMSARKALRLPDDAGFQLTLEVLFAFIREYGARALRKKGTPGSPDSSGDIPASSESSN